MCVCVYVCVCVCVCEQTRSTHVCADLLTATERGSLGAQYTLRRTQLRLPLQQEGSASPEVRTATECCLGIRRKHSRESETSGAGLAGLSWEEQRRHFTTVSWKCTIPPTTIPATIIISQWQLKQQCRQRMVAPVSCSLSVFQCTALWSDLPAYFVTAFTVNIVTSCSIQCSMQALCS